MLLRDKMISRAISLRWARKMIEVHKYNPEKYDNRGVYLDPSEWTDYISSTNSLSYYKYREIETKYVRVVLYALKRTNCRYVTLVNIFNNVSLEKYNNINCNKFKTGTQELQQKQEDDFLIKKTFSLKEGKRIHISNVEHIIRMCLRGYIEADICNEKRKTFIEFPGSFYMWITMPSIYKKDLSTFANEVGLNTSRNSQ